MMTTDIIESTNRRDAIAMHWLISFSIVVTASAVTASAVGAADETPVNYLRQVQPLLKQRCWSCHGALRQQGQLRLDTRTSLVKGGGSGPAIVPGRPAASHLIERVSSADPSIRMPPDGPPLSVEQIDVLNRWIQQGASAPENELPEADPREHWSFSPPVRPVVPPSPDGSNAQNAIDSFITAELVKQGLQPGPAAGKSVLLRRVYLDLIGLPPTPEELRSFLADDSLAAYETVVDRLLQDQRYGERWGRHWLDIWRYSDWYGRRHVPDVWNSAPQIWRWRDWVVRSLNADLGYDQMIRMMLAADEIAAEDEESVVATGFLIRNWYALNPNDWMRSNVEHVGKAFLGLTFNCAHCHDHKYDPILHDDYFRLRAYFEPISIRQDRRAGEADPGPFQEYSYGVLRKIQRNGLVRIFDKTPDAPTWFYTGGDERNRRTDRGSILPGVPAFLAGSNPQIEAVSLSPRAYYPGLRPGIQETMLSEVRASISVANSEYATLTQGNETDSQKELANAEAVYEMALKEAKTSGKSGALAGDQSLLLEATAGRRILTNGVKQLSSFPDGLSIEFTLQILKDSHVNFQLVKDLTKGLTAGMVAFENGRILSYQPGTVTEFEIGKYDWEKGQRQFHVTIRFDVPADRCLASVKSVIDGVLLVDETPVALNQWNPVGDVTKGIVFDARTGSIAAVDAVRFLPPVESISAINAKPDPILAFEFESPTYKDGQDPVGIEGWGVSTLSISPAISLVSNNALNESLTAEWKKLQVVRKSAQLPQLKRRAAEVKVAVAQAQLASLEARIAADRARYGETSNVNVSNIIRTASKLEREAALQQATLDVLTHERAFAEAEAKPAEDANRAKEITAASSGLAAAQAAVIKARERLADETLMEKYTSLSPIYPQNSTGRRRAIADWIVRRENPLTARVAVNHIWARHFHAPLVATVYDFGRNGKAPTHPELLDWLAVELMDSGWSMRRLHRLIVTSDAYRRSTSATHSDNLKSDPDNRFLWRMNPGRMEAEVVRDSLLSCAGKLDLTMGGQELENSESLKSYRRSLYYSVHPEVGGKSPLGELFDGPDAQDCYRRTETIIPQQALALTNSGLVHSMSTEIVARWPVSANNAHHDVEEFVVSAFERILTRSPTAQEKALCIEALERQRSVLAQDKVGEAERMARESLVRALMNHNDFVTIR